MVIVVVVADNLCWVCCGAGGGDVVESVGDVYYLWCFVWFSKIILSSERGDDDSL